ncbi:MAG TPA: glutamine amidotransferase [Clostridia bacterium]|nr:glutamine amidotransferase [Clostridia bacterium]
MCGIAGIINSKGMDISTKLIEMLNLIQHRGPDASGIALYGCGPAVTLRVSIKKKENRNLLMDTVASYATILSEKTSEWNRNVVFSEFSLKIMDEDIQKLHIAINKIDGLYVHSLGRGIKVYKDGGMIDNLLKNHDLDRQNCTHGMGHVRMATESAEDINAAHPFVSPFYPELSIVHNGQFTNYFNLRRSLESKGAIFKTLNDSEAASHLIAYAMMKNGGDLEAALNYALEEMDGIFCIIAATPTQIGFVKDKMGIKPLLLFEKDGITMLGSEQIEFTALFQDVYAEEMEPGEIRVWNI